MTLQIKISVNSIDCQPINVCIQSEQYIHYCFFHCVQYTFEMAFRISFIVQNSNVVVNLTTIHSEELFIFPMLSKDF